MDLDEELKKMHALAAAPELYPTVVKLGSLSSIIQLLLHDNVGTLLFGAQSQRVIPTVWLLIVHFKDIAIDAIDLLHELMEPDVAVDSEENALLLIDDFVWGHIVLSNTKKMWSNSSHSSDCKEWFRALDAESFEVEWEASWGAACGPSDTQHHWKSRRD